MNAWNPLSPEVPVDSNGNWLSYPSYRNTVYEYAPNFSDTLKVIGYSRGRSSVTIDLQGSDGKKYSMFISDFMDIMTGGIATITSTPDGVYFGATWQACKKGGNYGIKAAE